MAYKAVLSLDVGLTTGWAVHEIRFQVGTWDPGSGIALKAHGILLEGDYAHDLSQLILKYMVRRSVAEYPLVKPGKLGSRLARLIQDTEHVLMRQVDTIRPVDWKDSRWADHPVPLETTRHEKDAIRIGVWYIQERLFSV